MAKETKGQQQTVERVMHEFKHGELKSGPDGKAGKVRNPKQAIAIALSEAGASNQQSPVKSKRSLSKIKAEERQGKTAEQASEGKDAIAHNRAALYAQARKRNIPGRSKMSKAELETALRKA